MVVSGGSSQQPSPAPPPPPDVNNIMGGIEQTIGVRMHNHRRKLRQRFDLVRKLGQGTYGKVQLGINKETGQEVAIKTIKKAKIETEADLIRIRREIQIMSSVRHPNIIHIYEVFENKEKMVLVMEYAAGGELYDYLSQRKVLPEAEARRVFRQVASAVYYCHKHNICHRDLKLENILLDESKTAKIADFGLSNVFDDRRLLTTFCGSPLYASPEIVRGTPYHGPEVDCWSLGVLLYTLVYGAMPFDGSNFKRLVKQISSGEYYEPPDKPSTASPLVRHMLLVDPSKRATAEDICSHWWVNEGYGESCLEVAEELANQTPVRLDLLLSLVPPPGSTETVVVGPKMDVSQSSAAKEVEGDSMNEYYSSGKDQAASISPSAEPTSEPATSAAAAASTAAAATKSGIKKKKEGSTHGKEAETSGKKRRSEPGEKSPTDRVAGDGSTPTIQPSVFNKSPASPGPFDRAEDLASSSGPSPIDDSGIQTSEREEVTDQARLDASNGKDLTDGRAEVTSKPEAKPNVTQVDVDEGISTSSSWTRATAVASAPTQLPAQQLDGLRSSVELASGVTNVVAGSTSLHPIIPPSTTVQSNLLSSQSNSSLNPVHLSSAPSNIKIATACPSGSSRKSSVTDDGCANSRSVTLTSPVGDQVASLGLAGSSEGSNSVDPTSSSTTTTGSSSHTVVLVPPLDPAGTVDIPSLLVPHIPALGQSESQLMAGKMDVKGSVPAAAVVTVAEPENAASSSSPSTTSSSCAQSPSAPNQVHPPVSPPSADVAVPVSTVPAGPEAVTGAESSTNNSGKVIDGRNESSTAGSVNSSGLVANRRPANSHNTGGTGVGGAAEQRHSKILRQAEIFNSLMTHSKNEPPPKSTMTLERPKKVTIYGYKLNDTRKAFETRSEPKVPTIVPVLKVSDAKRAFENSVARSEQSQRNSTTTSHSHNSLPRRTLIQTPASSASSDVLVPKPRQTAAWSSASPANSATTSNSSTPATSPTTGNGQDAEQSQSGVQPGEKVVVGGLGVKIGAIGKVTEIGMKVKTEENHRQPSPQKAAKSKSSSSARESKPKTEKVKSPSEETTTIEKVVAVVKDAQSIEKKPSAVKEPVIKEPTTPTANQPKVKEIQVMVDTGESEPKLASMLVPVKPSPPKDPPPSSPALPTNIASTPTKSPSSRTEPPNERVATSPPPKPSRVASPPPRTIISPTPKARVSSPPPPIPTKQITSRPMSPPPTVQSRPTSPPNRPLSPLGRPLSPVYLSTAIPDRTEDDCIAGSENAFIRGIRSPTRDHPPAVAGSKRFSKGPAELLPAGLEAVGEGKPIQKSEINIAVSAASLSATPRERIIPIRVEGRELPTQSTALVTTAGLSGTDIKTLPKSLNSISVQLRATPPRLASPPPPVLPVAIRSSPASRQDSVQSTTLEPNSENKLMIREPIRKSPREFIIPITVEGATGTGVDSNPIAPETSSSSSSTRTNRFDRTKRYGSLYHDGETELDHPSDDIDSHPSPLHHLQRLSSFKKSHDEPDVRSRRGSGSSIDDDDDDETFQILTAESLFSTLLSRVRQLTRRNQRAENPTDPFVVFRNASRFASPAPSSGSRSRMTETDVHRRDESEDTSQISSPGCTSPTHHNNNNRNSTGSDLLAGSAGNKAFWNNIYSRASSVASESDTRRYSTLDPPRFYGETPQPVQSSGIGSSTGAGAPWRRETSIDAESNCSIASASMSPRGTTTTAYPSSSDVINGEDFNASSITSSRPFTSSLTRRVLNQHLRETNPELARENNGHNNNNNSDAMSETSSASGGNRSSLSWALSRLTGVLPPADSRPSYRRDHQQPQYSRAHSSRELGSEPGEPRRTYQRYGRSSTLDNIDPSAAVSASGVGVMQRIGSPLSDDDQPLSGISTPASYRTYTRTRSREYLSPNSSRGTSPVPSSASGASGSMTSPDSLVMNPIVPQLSTVLENGPLGVEGESSPRLVRAAETKMAVITSLNSTTNPTPPQLSTSITAVPSSGANSGDSSTIERKSRRISRFLRPDFYDAPKEDAATEKQRFLKSVEQRWDKYNPDAGLLALPKPSGNPSSERIIPILKPTSNLTTPSLGSTPSSPLQPILQARQNLTPIPISQPAQPSSSSLPPPAVILKPVAELAQLKPVNGSPEAPQPTQPPPPPPQQAVRQPTPPAQQQPVTNGKVNGTKSSPKLTVRRQFEHLINLAAAQFGRGQSPSKVAPATLPAPTVIPTPSPTPVVTPPSSSQPSVSQSEAISLELKQLEDEIKNTAAIKAQATARLDALKHELAVKSGAAPIGSQLPPIKPTIPAKPDYLSRPPPSKSPELPIPIEFQPFQYKGSNGVLRELSHLSHSRRDTLSPPTFPTSQDYNGRTPPPDGEDSVRFARIKRVDPAPFENSWANEALDTPGTPTDSYESSSVCSDLRGDQRADSGEDESVSERIFRKSFYTRFNEPGKIKAKHHQHRRSINKELPSGASEFVSDSNSEIGQPPIARRSSQHRKSLRDESAEAVMVRKFLSSGSESGTTHFERERRLSSTRRHHVSSSDVGDSTAPDSVPVGSREPSVARSVKSDHQSSSQGVTSPTPSMTGSDVNGRESRSYLRTYSSRGLSNDPPTNPTSPSEPYSSASLGRRSYYQSSSTNADHVSSLPRRSNRYSIQEPENGVRLRSTGSVLASRSSYVNSPSSRYSSILLEESGNSHSTTSTTSSVLSPNSARRHPNLSDALTRRESTFYGTPSHLSSRSGSASSSSAYFMRSTSSGLDHHHNNHSASSSGGGVTGAYATMRPSILRHRR